MGKFIGLHIIIAMYIAGIYFVQGMASENQTVHIPFIPTTTFFILYFLIFIVLETYLIIREQES